MCRPHWYMLRSEMRSAEWRVHKSGQELRKDPSPEYVRVAGEAVEWLAAHEGSHHPAIDRAQLSFDLVE